MNIEHDREYLSQRYWNSDEDIDCEISTVSDFATDYHEHMAAPLIARIAELENASKKYNFYTEQAKDLTDTDVRRVWISEAASKHPASAYIDAMPSSGKLFINIALTGMTTPEDAIEFAELVKFAAGLLED